MTMSSASLTFVAIFQTSRFPRAVLPTCSANRTSSSLVLNTSTTFGTLMIQLMPFIRQFSCVKEAFQPSMARIVCRKARDDFPVQQQQRNCPTHTQWKHGDELGFLRCTRALMQSLEILSSIFAPARGRVPVNMVHWIIQCTFELSMDNRKIPCSYHPT